MKIVQIPMRLIHRLGLLSGTVLTLAGCSEGVLDPNGPVGRAERVLLGDATAIMLAVIIPVIILTLVSGQADQSVDLAKTNLWH